MQAAFWRRVTALVPVCLAGALLTAQATAGDCRAMVRPLLLQQQRGADLIAEAREVCEVEAALGDADAEYQVALFALGLSEWAPGEAIPKIKSAAENGVSEAQYWLGWQYEAGPLLPNDIPLARQWYKRASDGDHRLALRRLADAHAEGELGLRRDAGLAALYRSRAERCANQSG